MINKVTIIVTMGISRFMRGNKVFIVYAAIGYVLYSQILFSPFRWDDIEQIVQPGFMHILKNIPLIFILGIRESGSSGVLFDFFYRPIPHAFYIILYVLGNGQPLLFH